LAGRDLNDMLGCDRPRPAHAGGPDRVVRVVHRCWWFLDRGRVRPAGALMPDWCRTVLLVLVLVLVFLSATFLNVLLCY
jgi:hypothetical protein